jgi:hypothetical protein
MTEIFAKKCQKKVPTPISASHRKVKFVLPAARHRKLSIEAPLHEADYWADASRLLVQSESSTHFMSCDCISKVS